MTQHPQDQDHRAHRWQHVGDLTEDRVSDLTFQRNVKKLCQIGERAVGELLAEIGQQRGIRTFIDLRLAAYAQLDPESVRAVGGDTFTRPPLYEVKK